jgi:hypothetical protein
VTELDKFRVAARTLETRAYQNGWQTVESTHKCEDADEAQGQGTLRQTSLPTVSSSLPYAFLCLPLSTVDIASEWAELVRTRVRLHLQLLPWIAHLRICERLAAARPPQLAQLPRREP